MPWTQIIIWIATTIISYALRPKPNVETPQAAGLAEFEVPTAEEGRKIPVLFGTREISGPNCVWYGDLRSAPIRKKVGGK